VATIQIALVGDPTNPYTLIRDEEWERTWESRPKIELNVGGSETLASIFDQALRDFDVSDAYGVERHVLVDLALHDPTEPRGFSRIAQIVVVDDDGAAFWGQWDYRLITYDDVVRAIEAGAMEGDPARLVLILRQAAGNGVVVDWPSLLQVLDVAWDVIQAMAAAGGAGVTVGAIYRAVRDRLRRGREAAAEQAPRWARRGAAFPHTLTSFLGSRAWSEEDLARLLDCRVDEATAVLELFGFARDDDGLWRQEGDEPARLLRLIYEDVVRSYGDRTADEAKAEFRERITTILVTGQAISPPDLPDYQAMAAEWERAEQREKGRRAASVIGLAVGSFLLGRVFGRKR
jgi:hypothetical protein